MSSTNVVFTTQAFSKLLMHAMKYPHCAVSGVLLSPTGDKNSKPPVIVDAIPMFHSTPLGLAPLLEVALTQIDAYCRQTKQVISGYYQANEHVADSQVNAVAMKIVERIGEEYPEPTLVMVDNRALVPGALKVYRLGSGQLQRASFAWKQRIDATPEDTADIASLVLGSKIYRHLVDFDNHMDDLPAHWTNKAINKQLEELLDCYK